MTLETIAQDHNSFYEGQLAQDIVDDIKEYGKFRPALYLHYYVI